MSFTHISDTKINSHLVLAFKPTLPPETKQQSSSNRLNSIDHASHYQFVKKWGSVGSADGQFFFPDGLAIDLSGNVYVVDRGNNRIQVFAPYTKSSK
jgi:DNA-binding beta-propeller fold protein YncE